ncbi:hypothetical protein ACT3SQ_16425 [Brachybacterium sp. AOP42-C2-15]|uniref:hypothetical protein n=1 Tax=Brachybacterium sp. AOP42-C2-15 TaxID=3457670 RepID=UPI00403395A3
MLDSILYRRGFLVTPAGRRGAEPDFLSSWTLHELGAWWIHVHPETPVAIHPLRGTESAVAVLGDIFVAHGRGTVEEAAMRYASHDYAVLDDLSGRFALLAVDGAALRLVQDPMGAQTVFSSDRHHVAASHAALLAEHLGLARSRSMNALMQMPEQKAKTTRFLPGDRSLYDDVRLLPPNVELDLQSGTTSRYWPHSPLPQTGRDDVLAVWDEYFENYARHLAGHDGVVLGLTGGVDSRGMIAALRSKGLPMRYESWAAMKEEESSRIPAMVEHLGGPHRWIDIRERINTPEGEALAEAGRRAAGYTRGLPTMPALAAQDAAPRDVFVYGHGGGVTAGPYSRRAKAFLPEAPLDRAYYLNAGPQRKNASPEYKKANRLAFGEFLERAHYDGDLHGVDPGLLLYWEHRMANWAALQIAVHAIGMNAHAGINSRRLYSAFWGLPESPHEKKLHAELIAIYDPVLAGL